MSEVERADAIPQPYDRAGPFIVGSAIFLQTLDATIVAGGLPTIARSLGESALSTNAAITYYLLASAVCMPISGWLSDRFGAKRVFQAAVLLFTLASLFCGLSQALWQLIAARVLQGAAGAMITPVGRLVLLQRTPREHLVQAISFLGIPIVLGPVLGPVLGGFIVTFFTWHWIFLINIPIGIVALLLSRGLPHDEPGEAPYPLDWRGLLLSGFGLASMIVGASHLGRPGVGPLTAAAPIVLGLVSLALYVAWSRRTEHPILDLTLLRIPTFFHAIIGSIMLRVAVGAMPLLLALMLQLGFGLNPLNSGLITFTSAAAAMIMKMTARPILARFGFRRVLLVNTVCLAATLAVCAAITPRTSILAIIAILLIGGFFRSLQFTSLNTLTFADVQGPAMSRGSGLSSVVQQLAETLSVSLVAVLLTLSLRVSGHRTIAVADVAPLFGLLAAISLAPVLVFLRLPPSAGAAIAGRGRA